MRSGSWGSNWQFADFSAELETLFFVEKTEEKANMIYNASSMMMYLILIGPTILLGMLAQWWVQSAYQKMSQVPARISGHDAARRILDANGLYDVPIEPSHGVMSDHYDPSSKVVRLSHDVYYGHSMSAVGIAAHEVGHALQDARGYAPLVVRNLAVPVANFGGSLASAIISLGVFLMIFGMFKLASWALLLAVIGFAAVVVFQLVNLPVEFNASSRAKDQLLSQGIVSSSELPYVSSVLTAAAMTYVAGTFSSVMNLIYYVLQYAMVSDRDG
jgi:Zn-dependent membrane protease YugP